jgi:hypothetical protein
MGVKQDLNNFLKVEICKKILSMTKMFLRRIVAPVSSGNDMGCDGDLSGWKGVDTDGTGSISF